MVRAYFGFCQLNADLQAKLSNKSHMISKKIKDTHVTQLFFFVVSTEEDSSECSWCPVIATSRTHGKTVCLSISWPSTWT